MAPAEASTLPEAEAIVIADAAGPRGSSHPEESKLKILPPSREAPVGLLRLEAAVEPPIKKVEFYLSDRLILTRTRPPYSVEIDLGDIPRKQTLRAVGYDETGRVIDEDAWAINEGSARVAVRLLPLPDPATGKVRVRIAVQSIGGGTAKKVELFLDAKKVGAWTSAAVRDDDSLHRLRRGNAPARDRDHRGRQGSQRHPDAARGRPPPSRAVRVDVVQLHVSALDKESPLRQGADEGRLQDPGGRQARGR